VALVTPISWSRLSAIPLWLVSTFRGIFMVGEKSEAEFELATEELLGTGSERTVWMGRIPNNRIAKIVKPIKDFFLKRKFISY
jgi:hypothetical protein